MSATCEDAIVYATMIEVLAIDLEKRKKRLLADERLLAHVLQRVDKSRNEFLSVVDMMEEAQRKCVVAMTAACEQIVD